MKKTISLIMISILLLTFTSSCLAEIEKLDGHWANGIVDEEFINKYFSYLSQDNYKRFVPNGNITVGQFTSSMEKLFCEYGYCLKSIESNEVLTRRNMSSILYNELIRLNIIESSNYKAPFIDIDKLSDKEKIAIATLYKNNIIKGNSQNTFSPEKKATQVECIILLMRAKGVLESMIKNTIPFKVISNQQSYSNLSEGIYVKETSDKVLLTIVKMFPTPGYSMDIERIIKGSGGEFEVHLSVYPPKEGSIQLQVITYKTIVIEVDKSELGEGPYTFKIVNPTFFNPISNKVYK